MFTAPVNTGAHESASTYERSTLEDAHWTQPRHRPRQAGALASACHFVDVFVSAGTFLGQRSDRPCLHHDYLPLKRVPQLHSVTRTHGGVASTRAYGAVSGRE